MTQTSATLSPEFSKWSSLVSPARGCILGKTLHKWQEQVRTSLQLPTDKPIVIVGHQPTFFHPGILAKFIAANRLAKQIDGVLVFLVVDHHKGAAGEIQTPVLGDHLSVHTNTVAMIDSSIAMKDQLRVETKGIFEPFTTALQTSSGENASMQFSNAIVNVMSPWIDVHHIITASDLLYSEFGIALVSEMNVHPSLCIESYNDAVAQFPESDIPTLIDDELPLWQGPTNSKTITSTQDLRPRALLLTLLARLVACDVFVHGTGGERYDQCMEQWCKQWLGVTPCNATMATATLQLQMNFTTLDDARREYFSPTVDQETKSEFLDAIQDATCKSPERQLQFQKMHQWLATIQPPLDLRSLKDDADIAKRKDWAFPLYPTEQLHQLHADIESM